MAQVLVVAWSWNFARNKRRRFWLELTIALHVTTKLVCAHLCHEIRRVGIHADKGMMYASSLFSWGWLHEALKVGAKVVQRMLYHGAATGVYDETWKYYEEG